MSRAGMFLIVALSLSACSKRDAGVEVDCKPLDSAIAMDAGCHGLPNEQPNASSPAYAGGCFAQVTYDNGITEGYTCTPPSSFDGSGPYLWTHPL